MNIRDLRYFVMVAELKHFGKAAEKCCVTQPTLSGQIKKLEEQLDVKLFERTNRRVILTEVGQQILHSARTILKEVDKISDTAQSSHDPLSGKFSLGAFPTLATYIFPSLVTKIKTEMPSLRLVLVEEKTATLIEKLKNGEIDAAFLAMPIDEESLVGQTLFEDEFYLAVPATHKLTKYSEISQKSLQEYPLLLLEEGHCLRDQALEICHMHHLGEEQDVKAASMETLRQMVKAGTGITFIPQIAIYKNEQDICYIPFSDPKPTRTIGIIWRKTSQKMQIINNIIQFYTQLSHKKHDTACE